MNRAELSTEDFNYDLPEERIAKYPLANRNQSKLLTYSKGKIGEAMFSDLQQHLPPEAVLVFNDTKVLAARLYFKNKTGAKIEIFCLEPFESTVEQALTATNKCQWQCLVGNLKRFKENDTLVLEIAGTLLKASIVKKRGLDVVIHFEWGKGVEFSAILQEAGEIPLPPYLNRKTELADQENYQTVYAKTQGAVAAPTAGLHFVKPQLEELQRHGHKLAYLTLYVGAGTFRSVSTDKLISHHMHEERIVISKAVIAQMIASKGKMICVGTTSLRSLESLYWLAVKIHHTKNLEERNLRQEDAYELSSSWTWQQAFQYLFDLLEQRGENEIDFHSALFIMPSYNWKVIDGLITNFHQPKSTLLALIAAWIGPDWKRVYNYALENDFRFLSYGDSSILLR